MRFCIYSSLFLYLPRSTFLFTTASFFWGVDILKSAHIPLFHLSLLSANIYNRRIIHQNSCALLIFIISVFQRFCTATKKNIIFVPCVIDIQQPLRSTIISGYESRLAKNEWRQSNQKRENKNLLKFLISVQQLIGDGGNSPGHIKILLVSCGRIKIAVSIIQPFSHNYL